MSFLVDMLPKLLILIAVICANGFSLRIHSKSTGGRQHSLSVRQSYLDELNLFKAADKKVLVGFTTDAWNIGQRKYKDFLAVHKMTKKIQKQNIACVEVPMWYVKHHTHSYPKVISSSFTFSYSLHLLQFFREISQGPHYEELQELFESFWIPDMTSPEQLLLQFDLTIIPDPVLAKYMVESFYEKEAKVAKSKTYYANLIKQPWGVIDAYPPKERYEYERIKNLSRQKWIRKFPPIATVGEEAYQRLKSHSQVNIYICTQLVAHITFIFTCSQW